MSERAWVAMVALGSAMLMAATTARAQMTPQELHDRIVMVFSSRARRPLPTGDTLVSWYRNPILFHTVHRGPNEIATGMVRADSLLGTAVITWNHDRPVSGEVHWTKGDSTEIDAHLRTDGDTLRVTGATPRAWSLPRIPWVIADYGMEDQAVPLLEKLDFAAGPVAIAAYRPYGVKWDTLWVKKRAIGDGTLYELRASDGKRDWWLVSRSGVLVQLRREGQDFERRPP